MATGKNIFARPHVRPKFFKDFARFFGTCHVSGTFDDKFANCFTVASDELLPVLLLHGLMLHPYEAVLFNKLLEWFGLTALLDSTEDS